MATSTSKTKGKGTYDNPNLKHVFIDIVQFTLGRTTDLQAEVIEVFKKLIQQALTSHGLKARNTSIKLPTGDGVCISIIDRPALDYDIHVKFALTLLRLLNDRNQPYPEGDPHRISVRIGINEHRDLIVKDINGSSNVAGDGINNAQRIMNFGDGGHIMLSQASYLQLRTREEYEGDFQKHIDYDKHGTMHEIYQYVCPTYTGQGLNVKAPLGKDKQNRLGELQRMRIRLLKEDLYFRRLIFDWRMEAEADRAESIVGGNTVLKCRSQYLSMVYYFRKILRTLQKGDYFKTLSSLKFWSASGLDGSGFVKANIRALEAGVDVKRVIVLDKRIVDLKKGRFKPKTPHEKRYFAGELDKLVRLLGRLTRMQKEHGSAFDNMEFTFYLASNYDEDFKSEVPLAIVGNESRKDMMAIKASFDETSGEPKELTIKYSGKSLSLATTDAFDGAESTLFDDVYSEKRYSIADLIQLLNIDPDDEEYA